MKVCVILLCFLTVGCSVQTSMIYPGRDSQGQDDAIVRADGDDQIVKLTAADGTKITAIFAKALDEKGQPRADFSALPTVIYFYGNGSCMAYSIFEFNEFRHCGANAMMADFEGYGMSAGSPSEAGCYATADAEYDYLLTRTDIDHSKIISAGWSLGAAVAIDLASRKPVAGLMTFSAFTSMDDMGTALVPWLPQSIFLDQHFNNLEKISRINCPVLIAHGGRDSLIPPGMSDRLADAAKGPVTRVPVGDADHNDVFVTGGAALATRIGQFLRGFAGKSPVN